MSPRTALLLPLCCLTSLACGGETFRAPLSGLNERPTQVTTAATGAATGRLEGEDLVVSGNFQGLTGAPTAAHVHGPAGREQTAPPLCTLATTAAASGTLSGTCPLDSTGVQALREGKLYVNVHTTQYSDGEIRGQLEAD